MYKVGDKVVVDYSKFGVLIRESRYPYRVVVEVDGYWGIVTEENKDDPHEMLYLTASDWDHVRPYHEEKEGVLSYDLDVYDYSFVGGHLVVAKKKEIK